MKPESRGSILNRSFRRSFRKKKPENSADKEEEERILYEFRKAVQDVIRPKHKDGDYKRFLQARDNDVENAEKLFRLDASYRKLLDLDHIMDYKLPEVNMKYNITGLLGCDKEGSPIRVLNLGLCDFKGFTQTLCTTELVRIFLWFMANDMQYLEEQNEKHKRNVDDFLYIVNLENFGMSQLMYKPVIDIAFVGLKLLQDHFFDVQKAIIVINAPSFYSTAYKLFKPVLQEVLDKKVKVFGTDDNWQKELLSRIDADVLPQYLGGKRVGRNDDPRCSDFIGQGGPIPGYYFPTRESYLDPRDPEVTSITIAAGSFANVPVLVNEAGTVVEWHIESKDMDLAIGIFYEPMHAAYEEPIIPSKGITDTPKMKRRGCETPKLRKKLDLISRLEPLTPVLRCHCHVVPETGSMVAWKPGLHVVHFDNSYSWLSSKQVLYKFTVKPPVNTKEGMKTGIY